MKHKEKKINKKELRIISAISLILKLIFHNVKELSCSWYIGKSLVIAFKFLI